MCHVVLPHATWLLSFGCAGDSLKVGSNRSIGSVALSFGVESLSEYTSDTHPVTSSLPQHVSLSEIRLTFSTSDLLGDNSLSTIRTLAENLFKGHGNAPVRFDSTSAGDGMLCAVGKVFS